MHQIKLASVVGSPLESGWSHVVSSQNKNIIAALAVRGNNAKNIGFELADIIKHQNDASPAAAHNLILDLLKKAREQEVSLHLALIGFNQPKTGEKFPTITLAAHQGQLLLKRENKVANILKSTKGLEIVEGSLRSNDQFVLATAQAEQLEQSIIRFFKSNLSPDALTSNLDQKVKMLIDSSLFAATILKIEELEMPKTSPVESHKIEMPISSQTTEPAALVNEIHKDNELSAKKMSSSDGKIDINKAAEKKDFSPTEQGKPNITADYPALDRSAKTQTASRKQAEDIESSAKQKLRRKSESDPDVGAQAVKTTRELQPPKESDEGDIKIKISAEPVVSAVKSAAKKVGSLLKKVSSFLIEKTRELIQKVKESRAKNTAIKIEEKESSKDKMSFKPAVSKPQHQTTAASSKTPKTTRFSQITGKALKILKKFPSVKPLKIFAAPLKSISRKKDVYLGKKKRINPKIILALIALILILAAAANLVIASINNQREQIKQELQPARDLLKQAQSIEDEDILKARDLASQSIETAAAIQRDLGNTRSARQQFQEFTQEAQNYFAQIDGQIEVTQLDVFFDLKEIFPNFLTSTTASNSQYLFFLDKEQRQLIALNPESKRHYQLTLDDDFTASDLAASNDSLYILNSGIYEISLGDINDQSEDGWSASPVQIKTEGDSDRGGIFIDFYESFLYVFNPDQRNIFRFITRDDGLSDPIGWLTNKQGIDFGSINSVSVDGQIWLTSNGGQILLLERGEPLEFEIKGLEHEFGSTISISTNREAEYLYVLEPAESRVAILSKSGEFVSQINSPTLAGTNQILVYETLNKAFAVSGSIIYQIDL